MKKTEIVKTNIESKVKAMKAVKNGKKASDLENGYVVADNEHFEFVLFNDIDEETGEVKEILAFIAPDGDVYSTNSKTFMREFFDLHEELKDSDETYYLVKKSGKTKAGRDFITCEIA